METFQCADGRSTSTPQCCSLCHGLEGQGHPSVPASLPAHCSPSSLNLLPFCHCCLPSAHPSFHSEPYCVPLSHTLPPTLTHSFTAQCIRQEHASFTGCSMKVEMETKAPHARACSLTGTEKNVNTMSFACVCTHTRIYTHTEEDILMGNSGAHGYKQSCICKSNGGCRVGSAAGWSQAHATNIKADMRACKRVHAAHSCT